MRVTVLGKSPSWQDRGGACSGYLVEHDGYALLLDCGSGVFGKLRERLDHVAVDAVLVSHLHADHILDLIPFASALTFGPRGLADQAEGQDPHRPPLVAPTGSDALFRRLGECWNNPELLERAFELREYEEAEELALGPLAVRFREVPHFITTYAVELTAPDGTRFTFGADCAPNEGLVEFAAGTDLLLLEATLLEPEPEDDRGHLTAGEAGDHARRAGARRTVLTHFSDELPADRLQREGEAALGGPLELAAEGAVYLLGADRGG